MPFLTINGITVNVVESQRSPYRVGGGLERMQNGALRSEQSATYWEHRFKTAPMSKADSKALRGLIEGDGHVLSFESTTTSTSYLRTSRSLSPVSTSGLSRSTLATVKKWGASGMLVNANVYASWNVGYTGDYTIFGWANVGGGLQHFLRTPTAYYVNGVSTITTNADPLLRVEGGILKLGDISTTGLQTGWDSVAVVPYVVPTSWVSSIYTYHSAQAWPLLPVLSASGDRMDGATTVRGEVLGDIDTVGHVNQESGVWESAGDAFAFALMQTP